MADLPRVYDIIIVGTGLTESILAAAFARIGKTVLHVDRFKFYGGEFSSHALNNLIQFNETLSEVVSDRPVSQTTDRLSIACNQDYSLHFFNAEHHWNVDDEEKEKILSQSRRFNIDLSPNIFYAKGRLIELLISSDVGRYCEFKMVSQILTRNGAAASIDKVPTSRSEVFKSTKLSMIEKRYMMKFVQSCVKETFATELIDEETSNRISFKQFLVDEKLPESVTHYLLSSVAMCSDESVSANQGLQRVRKFLTSVGRYGDSPFLSCVYGAGELAQCFCRMGAVFGAVYYLNLIIQSLNINPETNTIESVYGVADNESIKFDCQHLIMDLSYAPRSYIQAKPDELKKISHAVLITNKSLFIEDNQTISFMFLPKLRATSADVYCIEASSASHCCPSDSYLVYLFCESTSQTAKTDLDEYINLLFVNDKETTSDTKPKVIFSYFYNHLDSNSIIEKQLVHDLPTNLTLVGGFKAELDFDYHITKAEEIFRSICPGEEFMPRPPDPEDIIFDDQSNEAKQSDKHDEVTETTTADKPSEVSGEETKSNDEIKN